MNINDVSIILSLYKTKNIAKTADYLHYVPQNIYRCIDKVEEEFNVKIIFREKGKQITFTSKGEEIIPSLQSILISYQNIEKICNKRNTIIISHDSFVPSNISIKIYNKLISFCSCDDIQFVTFGRYHELPNTILDNLADLYFGYEENKTPLPFYPLCQDKLCLISCDSEFKSLKSISVYEVTNKNILVENITYQNNPHIINELEKLNSINIKKSESQISFYLNEPNAIYIAYGQFTHSFENNYFIVPIIESKLTFGCYYKVNEPRILNFLDELYKVINDDSTNK